MMVTSVVGGGAQRQSAPGVATLRAVAAVEQPERNMMTNKTRDGERTATFAEALTKRDFESLDKFCRNAGKAEQGLQKFVEMTCACTEGLVGVAILWRDLTSNHVSKKERYCTPSVPCNKWFCACDRHIRAEQASKPLLGALFRLSTSPDFVYLLPLAPGAGEQDGLPLELHTTLTSRWEAFFTILCSNTVQKVVFDLQLALLPVVSQLQMRGLDPGKIQNCLDMRLSYYYSCAISNCGSEAKDEKMEQELELEYIFQRSEHGPHPPDERELSAARVPRVVAQLKGDLAGVCAIMNERKEVIQRQGPSSWSAFCKVECPLAVLLAQVEAHGVIMATDGMKAIMTELSERQAVVARRAQELVPSLPDFNISSPEQLSKALFDVLKLPPPGASSAKGKHHSTAEKVLQGIAHLHPLVGLALENRSLVKTHAFIVGYEVFLRRGEGGEGRIHAQWNNTSTRTGRMSCCKPNLQQVTKLPQTFNDGAISINMRALIQPRPGWELVSADYSQIEVRVMAHFCGDRGLLQLFAERKDVYRLMGGMVFNTRPESVTEQQRNFAKVLALAAIYGQGVEQMAAKMNKSKAEAQQIQSSFFRAFPGIKSFMAAVKERARKTENVTTLLGFRRLLPDISSQDGGLRAAAERQAVNTVIQGSAADIIKLAMVMMNENIVKEFEALSLSERPRLLMAVHDELVYEVPPVLVDRFARLLSQVMEQEVTRSFAMKCPLVIDLSRGWSWGETKPFHLDERV